MKNRNNKQTRITRPGQEHLSVEGQKAFYGLIQVAVQVLARVGSRLAVDGLEARVSSGRLRALDLWTLESVVETGLKLDRPGCAEAAEFIRRNLIPREQHHHPRR